MAHLLDLVGLRLVTFGLQVKDFLHPVARENMVTPSDSFAELQITKDVPQILKSNVGVRRTTQNLLERLLGCHALLLPRRNDTTSLVTRSETKTPQHEAEALCEFNPGDDLLSHAVTRAVPWALEGLTTVFGMGTGVTPPV